LKKERSGLRNEEVGKEMGRKAWGKSDKIS